MKNIIPITALQNHIAVLGKTGAGKTSTEKLLIEQVVAEGARVCILDPIKSDWWGITLSRDGQKPGLPFDIIGGPYGSIALPERSGKAIGELVANRSLPLCVLDMADFGPGGHQRFFIDFASSLFKHNKGVVYLVIEEAHIFAPKERSGIGEENHAIYWAKMLGTASRTKGIRLVVATQRTQALHNAVLGSCETMIAHRFTAPADQEPVLKWFKNNVSADFFKEIAGSMSSLKTGEAWVCSGDDSQPRRVQFPHIKTFDNTATPDDDHEPLDVAMNVGAQEKLRDMLGKMIEEIEANDPVKLKERIAELEKQLKRPAAPNFTSNDLNLAEKIGYDKGLKTGTEVGIQTGICRAFTEIEALAKNMVKAMPSLGDDPEPFVAEYQHKEVWSPTITVKRETPVSNPSGVSPSSRSILDQIHKAYPLWISFDAAARRAGISKKSSAYRKYIKEVVTSGEVEGQSSKLRSLPAYGKGGGFDAKASIDSWASKLPPTYASMLRAIAEHGPLSKDSVAKYADVSETSSGLGSGLRQLLDLQLIEKIHNGQYQLAEGL